MTSFKKVLLGVSVAPILFQFGCGGGGLWQTFRFVADLAGIAASFDQLFGVWPGGPF
ncbi:MAG: hypothetical protein IPM18_05050 [Phycisphaerales bacterium]|nr:hypothetical protein [Phycisphaerales bacterium]